MGRYPSPHPPGSLFLEFSHGGSTADVFSWMSDLNYFVLTVLVQMGCSAYHDDPVGKRRKYRYCAWSNYFIFNFYMSWTLILSIPENSNKGERGKVLLSYTLDSYR